MKKGKGNVRPPERQAVLTTIVGGRPPGSGTNVGAIPRGIEVLVKKASVDVQFRAILLEKRAEAAKEIGLELSPPEVAMLRSIPHKQLEAIISATKVKPESRRAFLGKAASIMLAALGTQMLSCEKTDRQDTDTFRETGPDRPEEKSAETKQPTSSEQVAQRIRLDNLKSEQENLRKLTEGLDSTNIDIFEKMRGNPDIFRSTGIRPGRGISMPSPYSLTDESNLPPKRVILSLGIRPDTLKDSKKSKE